MRSRRKAAQSPISLFSFQDIVTSVCGIMILLTLLFALQVPPEPSLSTGAAVPIDRTQEITNLRKQLQALRVAESKLSLDRRASLMRINQDALKQQLASQKVRSVTLDKQSDITRREIVELSTQVLTTREAVASRAKNTRVHFIPGERSAKNLILVECSRSTLLLARWGEKIPATSFSVDALEGFFTEVRSLSRDNSAFVFLLKPSSEGYAMVLIEVIRKMGFEVGYDPLEENFSTSLTGTGT